MRVAEAERLALASPGRVRSRVRSLVRSLRSVTTTLDFGKAKPNGSKGTRDLAGGEKVRAAKAERLAPHLSSCGLLIPNLRTLINTFQGVVY